MQFMRRELLLPALLCVPALLCAAIVSAPAAGHDAAVLRDRYAALNEQLATNPFGRPLHVESSETAGAQKGDVYAVIARPYAELGTALRDIDNWCDILILPVNVKYCEAAAETLTIFVARRPYDPLEDTYRLDLRYDVAAGAGYLHIVLGSATGPFGTRDYRISLEAAPLDAQRTFMRLSYSYTPGLAARMAMQIYLATSGRDKVGFSVVDRRADGQPVFVDGVRGVVERNTMRYYLAVEAYLGALDAPASERLEKRLRDWHAAIERHPQLREIGRAEYLKMKRWEAARQRAGVTLSGQPAPVL
jgi:hypothetical protein